MRCSLIQQAYVSVGPAGENPLGKRALIALTGSRQILYYSELKATIWHITPTRFSASLDLPFRGTYVRYRLSSAPLSCSSKGEVW